MTTNNLINAKSPYLLQHAHNPVNWHIWGDEAFKKAKDEPRYLLAAEKASRFIFKNFQDKNGRLLHSYYKGTASVKGMIDDYAFFIHGLIELYEAGFNPLYLREAKRLTDEMIRLFRDEKSFGFFFTGEDTEEILFRQKEIYDGSIPSGNSVAAMNLIRLERFTRDKNLKVKTDELFKYFSKAVTENLEGYPQLLSALDLLLSDSSNIIISVY